ncbi:MAG TPA: MFS transporter [Acidimicrobiia bacterium]|nr:MFS transporter [Acidimicrobiia bacterium]
MSFVRTLTALGPRYRALWIGQTISQFGTYVAFLTLPLLVLHIQEATGEGSTLDFAITYALETAPTILVGLAAGVLLDRWNLRPVMVVTDLGRAAAFFYLTANLDSYGITTVFLMAFLIGSMTTLFDGALYTIIPALVPKERLADANGFVAASQQANFALGPLAAGVLATTTGSPAIGLFINAVTFVISAISLIWVGRVQHHRRPDDERAAFFTEAANGVRYIWAEARLRITTIAAIIPNFVIGFIEATFVVLAVEVLQASTEAEIGILLAALGVGGVVGALVAPRIIRSFGLGKTLVMGMGFTGLAMLSVMFTTYGALAIGLQVGWMIGVSVINVPLATIRQHYAPPSMIGRVITASRALGWASLPLGALIGGWLGASEETYPWVARTFPLLLVGTALWLLTTVVWTDTFGPGFEGRHERPVSRPTGV